MIVRSDGEIQAAVLDELAWDHRVLATGIEVSVHRRIVTLTGTVRSDAERLAAEAAARRLYGVKDVINGIEVRQFVTRRLPRRSGDHLLSVVS